MSHRQQDQFTPFGEFRDPSEVTRRRFLWGLGGAAGWLATSASATGAAAPFTLEVTKLDVYGTRDPQLMALPSLAEIDGYFKDEGLTVNRHFVASAGELPNMLASGNISIGCGGVTTLMILNGQGVPVYGIVQQHLGDAGARARPQTGQHHRPQSVERSQGRPDSGQLTDRGVDRARHGARRGSEYGYNLGSSDFAVGNRAM